MKKILRSLQTFFPFFHDIRFRFKLLYTKYTHIPHEADFKLLRHFSPDDGEVLIDVGSNRGESISSMLATLNTENSIVGFEPNPLIFKKLKKTFTKNERIVLYNAGLGNNNANLNLYIPYYRKWMFDGLSSFKYEAANDWLKHQLWGFNPRKFTMQEAECAIRRLDDYHLQPCFIKIDVQGYELEVLRGGQKTIEQYKPVLLIEAINDGITAFLEKYNYHFFTYKKGRLVAGNGTLNTFCIPDEKLKLLSAVIAT